MKVILLQSAIADYRQNFLEVLVERLGRDLVVFTGAEHFEGTTKTDVSLGEHLRYVTNHYLLGRKLLFQTGMWRPALEADVAILELNPRILSVWLLLLLRKALGKRSLLWGHAWPREGRHKKTDHVRNLMRRLGDAIIVYTDTQARELRERMPDKPISSAPNAMYFRSMMGVTADTAGVSNIIYVGRLVATKKPMLLLEAFAAVAQELPADCKLLFVGDGPLMFDLKLRARELQVESRVVFEGHISDVEKLRELYDTAIVSVSPGYVGLSIVQSFAFGVPMIVARDEPHAPEIEALMEGANGRTFTSDSVSDLSEALLAFVRDRDVWIERRTSIMRDCVERYSVESMAERMAEVVERYAGKRSA